MQQTAEKQATTATAAHTARRCHAYHAMLRACGPKTQKTHSSVVRYCHQRGIDDGTFSLAIAETLADSPRPYRLINKLLQMGLWTREGDRLTIADYAILPRPDRPRRVERAMRRRLDSTAVIPVNIVDAARAYVRPPPSPDCPFIAIAMRRTGKTADQILAEIKPLHDAEVASMHAALAAQQARLRAEDLALAPGGEDRPVPWTVAQSVATERFAALGSSVTARQRQDWRRVQPTLRELRAALDYMATKHQRDWGLLLWWITKHHRAAPGLTQVGATVKGLVPARQHCASTDTPDDSHATSPAAYGTAGTAAASAMAG